MLNLAINGSWPPPNTSSVSQTTPEPGAMYRNAAGCTLEEHYCLLTGALLPVHWGSQGRRPWRSVSRYHHAPLPCYLQSRDPLPDAFVALRIRQALLSATQLVRRQCSTSLTPTLGSSLSNPLFHVTKPCRLKDRPEMVTGAVSCSPEEAEKIIAEARQELVPGLCAVTIIS